MLYPQNGGRILTIESVTSLHPVYKAISIDDNRRRPPCRAQFHSSRIKLHREAEKRNHFSFRNKSFNTRYNLTKFSTGTLIVNEYFRRCYLSNFWNLH